AGIASARGGQRRYVLRHSVGLRGRTQRAPPRQTPEGESEEAPLRGDQDPAEEPHVALEARRQARGHLPRRLHPRFHAAQSRAPQDDLLPVCRELDIGVIARVPFDEGSLTGTLTRDATWPKGDFRNLYFSKENLAATMDRIDKLTPLMPKGMTLPEMALRFIL